MLTEKDIKQITAHGLTEAQVYADLNTFTKGIPHTIIIAAASIGNGIELLNTVQKEEMVRLYDNKKKDLDIIKFVPASGAATRMFKFLHQFLQQYNPDKKLFEEYIKEPSNKEIAFFSESIKNFAFFDKVEKILANQYPDYETSSKGKKIFYFVEAMLSEKGLHFGDTPKGLIPFHAYNEHVATAFEEQLYEGAFYASSKEEVYLHFTFSDKHVSSFKKEFKLIKTRISNKTNKKFHISYSFQKNSTDTLAVDNENNPFRDENNKLIFRPSGHGALLDNLNEIDADIVFIKNIDNVCVQEYATEIAQHKKILAGKLLSLQTKIFAFLTQLENKVTINQIKQMKHFISHELNIKNVPEDAFSVKEFLNRPLRVCGVVKNTGAPGGGPFWVKDKTGITTLQIVEKSQVNTKEEQQATILNQATHFNPVDIVCGLRDYKGSKFNLTQFVDPDAGFISEKSQGGKPLKALELPGLWNGAMAKWNTIFVEVPLITFNPVKTVNDLLKREHCPNI